MAEYKILKTDKKDSEIELEAEISAPEFDRQIERALAEVQRDMELPGFRRGKAPMEKVRENVNMPHLWEDAAHAALRRAVPEIVRELNLPILGSPQITLLKLAPGNPLHFKFRAALIPDFKLPNYRKMAEEVFKAAQPPEVTDAEVDKTLAELAKLRSEGQAEPFVFTDENAKTLGNFQNLAELKVRVRENMVKEKEEQARGEMRERVAGKLVDETRFTVPSLLVEEEAMRLRDRRGESAKEQGFSMEDFLKQIGKTEEEASKVERSYIERQYKTRFILKKIAEEEKIAPDKDTVDAHVEFLARRHPDADREELRSYAADMLRNEAVLDFLETGKKPGEGIREEERDKKEAA